MKLQYLGTAAAEGFPGVFCTCENCLKAWKNGGRNIRSRSQAIIDGKLLVDWPSDTFYHSVLHKVDLAEVSYCLITHSHPDHCYPDDLFYARPGFSEPPEGNDLWICGSADVYAVVGANIEQAGRYLKWKTVEPFQPFTLGIYTITALKAQHGTASPYIYSISDGKSNFLYAHDTDYFPDETWAYLRTADIRFDLVSMDCTEGASESLPYIGHMCLGTNKRCREMLLKLGAADNRTKFVLNHFSHNGLLTCYDDFAPLAEKDGFLTSYDGMIIEV